MHLQVTTWLHVYLEIHAVIECVDALIFSILSPFSLLKICGWAPQDYIPSTQ